MTRIEGRDVGEERPLVVLGRGCGYHARVAVRFFVFCFFVMEPVLRWREGRNPPVPPLHDSTPGRIASCQSLPA